MDDYTMITTCDTDIHLIGDSIDTVRLKCERVKWLVTVDGRYVNSANVVSMWTPTEYEIEGFSEALNG